MVLQPLCSQVSCVYINKGKSTVHQQCSSSLSLYFQLGCNAWSPLTTGDMSTPSEGPRLPISDTHYPPSVPNANPLPGVPTPGAYLQWLQPTKWARHLLFASFSWGVGHNPPSFVTTGTFIHIPDTNTAHSLSQWPVPPTKPKTARARAPKDASQQKVICFELPAQRPNIHPRTSQEWAPTQLWTLLTDRVPATKMRTPSAVRKQGTKMPPVEQSQPAGHPQASGGHSPSSLCTPASHGSLYCRGPGFWVPQLQILGPTGHSLGADIHIITSVDTGIRWFNNCYSSIPPAAGGELTPSMSFKYQLTSMPKHCAHRDSLSPLTKMSFAFILIRSSSPWKM